MNKCPIVSSKDKTSETLIKEAIKKIEKTSKEKINLVWIEATGCSGNIISLLNAADPDVNYFLKKMVNFKYNNSLMAPEGERAYEVFLETLKTEFILVVEGAVSTADNGLYTVLAKYQGEYITAMEAIKKAGEKAKYILAVGTCASFGGISAADPNPSKSISVGEFLKKEIINIPGCPGHPEWIIGTIAHLISFGLLELDRKQRPIVFYGITIHDHCPRRSYFDKGIFAQKLGDKECMFKLGCRGPVTRTDCPYRRWNDTDNWPIGNNTPCIGCATEGFPDGMQPFIRY
ncbi:hydrogenase small subunit [Desulfonispora thiosulfatigenes DSM 11270]|uniref:Hydrogenase small subunit n=1 Tax=Desulfonispora thiosulfatigenes DSM 11270 TaxID=656914 RepID=A0A1W1VAL1_DESTI|nr:hydrogenase small subunit [Desulfonispora thiosulfatigenes]SMB90517.1 hydrogenase small subunit [Desulfonispora thiosulfatigenes DSM 11270]